MASNFQKEEEIQERDSIVIGKSAQDGVNMAIANAAGGEGFGYGQYLQVMFHSSNFSSFGFWSLFVTNILFIG